MIRMLLCLFFFVVTPYEFSVFTAEKRKKKNYRKNISASESVIAPTKSSTTDFAPRKEKKYPSDVFGYADPTQKLVRLLSLARARG